MGQSGRPAGRGYGLARGVDPFDTGSSARDSGASPRARSRVAVIVGMAVAALILLVAYITGAIDATNTTFVVMGFDPDRAQLITSLLIGGITAAAVNMVIGRFGVAVVLGFVVATVLFIGTFTVETQGALAANGVTGVFDLGGWLLTLLTLIVIGLSSAWAGAALAFTARPFIIQAVAVLRFTVNRRRVEPRSLRYPLAVGLVLALLVVTVPAFGDLVNLAPDSLMRGGAPQLNAVATTTTSNPSPDSTLPSAGPSIDLQTATPAVQGPTPPAGQSARPWLAWLPTGSGLISSTSMAAPWKGGTAADVNVTVYTPPGYDQTGTRRYPVLYEVPTSYRLWGGATNVKSALDTLIDSGSIPAMIVVFIDSAGGPFPDTECADSFDHRQWYDTFVGVTMVGWVDTHYKSIVGPGARALAGMSEGGFCAAILSLRHHTVFGTSISFSGYYQAGAAGGSSAAVFGGDKALMAAYSPTTVAGQLDAAARARLYFIIVAKPDQPEYGVQAADFEKVLSGYGYRHDVIVSSEPHGWPQVRDNFPTAVEAWSARMVAVGVF